MLKTTAVNICLKYPLHSGVTKGPADPAVRGGGGGGAPS